MPEDIREKNRNNEVGILLSVSMSLIINYKL